MRLERQKTFATPPLGFDPFVPHKLTYPSGISANWTYEPTRDLLTSVTNLNVTGEIISRYDYTNDILGRRTSKNEEQYGYNTRNELISADELSYAYDDIGNRTTAEGLEYTANNLNQYTAIDTFTPEYDLDGNQTKILTSTGEWQVEYNAENRPIRWTQGTKVITMDYDRMGRRVFYKEMNGSTQVTYTCFLYNGYLCIQQLFSNSPWNIYKEFIWDPTEPVATRPLVFRQNGQTSTFLMHDGNKNVTDVVTVAPNNEVVGHYEYAPFGAITAQTGTRASANPFRFSSEFQDDTLGLIYYNYRHYNPKDGRWCGRDSKEEQGGINLYVYCVNNLGFNVDYLGLFAIYLHTGGVIQTSVGHVGMYDKNKVGYDYGRYLGTYSKGGLFFSGPNILRRTENWVPGSKKNKYFIFSFNVCPIVDETVTNILKRKFDSGDEVLPRLVIDRFWWRVRSLRENERYMGSDWSLSDNCRSFTLDILMDASVELAKEKNVSQEVKEQAGILAKVARLIAGNYSIHESLLYLTLLTNYVDWIKLETH